MHSYFVTGNSVDMKRIQLFLFPFLVHTSATITLDCQFTDEVEKTKGKGTVGCFFFSVHVITQSIRGWLTQEVT